MSLVKNIKYLLTFIYHPIVFCGLHRHGSKNFIIGKRGRINTISGISIGSGTELGYDSRIIMIKNYAGGAYKPECNIGKNVSIANRFTVICASKVKIEDDNLIASDVCITSHNHGINPEDEDSYALEPLTEAPVTIKNGCWIGEKVVILPGVTIGERCIIGAGSIVTRSIPPYSMAVGNPARVIKRWDTNRKEWVKI